jgi:hypothetical protein
MSSLPARRPESAPRDLPSAHDPADPLSSLPDATLDRMVAAAFAPLDKRAFGVAVGVAAAAVIIFVTVADLLVDPHRLFPLGLLGVYLRGYDVTLAGALIGALWMFGVGFVAGWFAAFARNVVLAIVLIVIRARLHLLQTRNILDHL